MSTAQNVLLTIRKMIISGEIPAGTRLAEIPTAKMLGGVSRQPVRLAFHLLEQEGLLVKTKTRGYRVPEVTENTINNVISVRSVLEGLAASQLAERGLTKEQESILLKTITETDYIFQDLEFSDEQLEIFEQNNEIFHNTIIDGSQNPALIHALTKTNQLHNISGITDENSLSFPSTITQTLTPDQNILMIEYQRLHFAHLQHCSIFEALLNRDSNRAEMLMREHARVGLLDQTIAKISALNMNNILK
ncbi:GntR family transcriptional regulator [Acinetobacter calcoaceticus]|uniref:GntR family transcriptional regulator n=1 Tax=Acinetobacter calcoaceticus TaxID=471 RepID=UPI00192C8828|nr:GntR family transcriptional regulator [Acinetobacter calcoaceticus]